MITIAKLLRVITACPHIERGSISGDGSRKLYLHPVGQLTTEEHNYLIDHGFVFIHGKGDYSYLPKNGNYIHGSLDPSFCLGSLDLARFALALFGGLGLRLWLVRQDHIHDSVQRLGNVLHWM